MVNLHIYWFMIYILPYIRSEKQQISFKNILLLPSQASFCSAFLKYCSKCSDFMSATSPELLDRGKQGPHRMLWHQTFNSFVTDEFPGNNDPATRVGYI